MLNRVFSPETKAYAYSEKTTPEYVPVKDETTISVYDTIKKEVPAIEKIQAMNKKSHLLPEVTVKEKKKWRREGEGLRQANIVIDLEKSVDQFFLDKGEDEPGAIPEFLAKTNPYFTYEIVCITDCSYVCRYKGRSVMFRLDNNPLTGKQLYQTMSIEIETITINESGGVSIMYDPKSDGNEVVIYLYSYKDHHLRKSPYGIRTTKFDGYAPVKEFYSPRYDKALLPDEKDYRRTLYWNPDVRTDKDGKATFTFYNNSTCKKMNISAETVTENGEIGVLNK